MYSQTEKHRHIERQESTAVLMPALSTIDISEVSCVVHESRPAPTSDAYPYIKPATHWITAAMSLQIDNRIEIATDECGDLVLPQPYWPLMEAVDVAFELLDREGRLMRVGWLVDRSGETRQPDDLVDLDGNKVQARELVGKPGRTRSVTYLVDGFGEVAVTQVEKWSWLAEITTTERREMQTIEVVPAQSNKPEEDGYRIRLPKDIFCCEPDGRPQFQIRTTVECNQQRARTLLCKPCTEDATCREDITALIRCSSLQMQFIKVDFAAVATRTYAKRFLFSRGHGCVCEDVVSETLKVAASLEVGKLTYTRLSNQWLQKCKNLGNYPALSTAELTKFIGLARKGLLDHCRYNLVALDDFVPQHALVSANDMEWTELASKHQALCKHIASVVGKALDNELPKPPDHEASIAEPTQQIP